MPDAAPPPPAPPEVAAAVERGDLSAGASENIARALADAHRSGSHAAIRELIDAGDWAELDALYFEVIPFGTGGRRGRMSDHGTATMNPRTVAESADGLARYLADQFPEKAAKRGGLSAVVAHDTRHRSEEFARLTATTLAARGVRTFVFRGFRSTPELSFAVRHLGCDAGVMLTASHNPPSDNGFKAYWNTGGQVLPPHDRGIIDAVYASAAVPTIGFDEAVDDGLIEVIGEEIDSAYISAVADLSLSSNRDVAAVYTSLHGVGETNVFNVLDRAGFRGVELLDSQRDPDGGFPTVDANFPNPERLEVYEPAIARAKEIDADLVLATDPDSDRLGVCAKGTGGEFRHLSGNRVGALICDHVLRKRSQQGTLPANGYVVETLVTTRLIGRIAQAQKVRVIDDLLVGFKYIGQTMDQEGPDAFLFGAEESLGYLAGQYARDKDAAVAALYVMELAASLKSGGKTLHDRLDELFVAHGYHTEGQFSEKLPGSGGKEITAKLMKAFRSAPPTALGGVELAKVLDYADHEVRSLPGNERIDALPEPDGNLLIFQSDAGSGTAVRVAVRPSGTEPKIKFYTFATAPVSDAGALPNVKAATDATLAKVQGDLSAWVAAQLDELS
ncbi:phospho-sugar mutase [Alienimonas californiensis]|uniref:Phosphoglucomutase n=1 Tax=Alienimonas californiensis TaxID=2527989 RepID=A0A517PEE2_9PLAN|nr:phospho-sugar mutase [Alienimonas californiensis]QDT17746.1 Phosphoglucomutase [Alienimonas californiensis]